MAKLSWKETELFKALSSREDLYAKKISNLLENPEVMDKIENILDNGGTTPKDFTLHDSGHSFRVADTMWSLIPTITKESLSSYELGFLILSAYLHDIGMSPNFAKVENHRIYITTTDKSLLTDDEVLELQRWIDNNDRIKAIDIRKENVNDINVSNYLLSYYIRYKHNDWSEVWIRENLSSLELFKYLYWTDDLILICKSHHYDMNHLVKNEFDLKPVSIDVNMHLRFLAMCLRIADVMENDPERTPEVILNHRSIHANSLVYWLKDKRFTLIRKENRFTIYARPEKAYLHKAILETALMIEDELKLCEELTKIKPLKYSTIGEFDYYQWNLDTYVHIDIKPKDDLYTYIKGGFRPNTAKILDLLGGNKLYGDSIWAFREIVQNAFDAVKEAIAYQIINEDRNANEYLVKLADLHSIDITLEKRIDGYWLLCNDQGVGMTKGIIEKFFLESGSSKRHEISELERKTKERGFNLGRTGQFGIGVLSYFMLADKLIIRTKRKLNTGYNDNESIAWRFEINGAYDFGELNILSSAINGTMLELKLKQSIQEDILNWDKSFNLFIEKNVILSPCRISYKSCLEDTKSLTINPGWAKDLNDVKTKISRKVYGDLFKSYDENKISTRDEKEKFEIYSSLKEEMFNTLESKLDFLYCEEKVDKVGKYRIFMPYFKLSGGNSFVYLSEKVTKGKHYISKIDEGHYWIPEFNGVITSLKGVSISVGRLATKKIRPLRYSNAYIEFDIESLDSFENKNESLSISRHNLTLDESFVLVLKSIDERIEKLISDNITLFDNIYDTLNYHYSDKVPVYNYWAFALPSEEDGIIIEDRVWKKAEYPLYNYGQSYISLGPEEKDMNIVKAVKSYNNYSSDINWMNYLISKYTLPHLLKGGRISNFLKYWPKIECASDVLSFSKKRDIKIVELPVSCKDVTLLMGDTLSYFGNSNFYINQASNLFKYYDAQNYINHKLTAKALFEIDRDIDKATSLSILIYCISEYKQDQWVALSEHREEYLNLLFDKLEIQEFNIIFGNNLVKIALGSWKTFRIIGDIFELDANLEHMLHSFNS